MRSTNIENRKAQLADLIEIKEAELSHRVNRHKEIAAWPTQNKAAQRRFLTRLKTEMVQMTEELNTLKTELWGLEEINLSGSANVW